MDFSSLFESSTASDSSYSGSQQSTVPSLDHESTSIQSESPKVHENTSLPLPSTINPQDLWLTTSDGLLAPPLTQFDPLPALDTDNTKWMLVEMSKKLENMDMLMASGNARQARQTMGLEDLDMRVRQIQEKVQTIENVLRSMEELKLSIGDLIKAVVGQPTH